MQANYRYEAVSVDGFVEQLVRYINTGHYFYVTGRIPEGKDVESVDKKLLIRYEVPMPRWQRARRKQAGIASVHYLRHERFFVLVATHGHHRFFVEHRPGQVRDCRRVGIKFAGYSIACKRGGYLRKEDKDLAAVKDEKFRVRVQVTKEVYLDWKAYFLHQARRCSAERLARELHGFPYEPYAPVRQQMLNILRLVNKVRAERGFSKLEPSVLRYRRRIVKPFELSDAEASGEAPAKVAVNA